MYKCVITYYKCFDNIVVGETTFHKFNSKSKVIEKILSYFLEFYIPNIIDCKITKTTNSGYLYKLYSGKSVMVVSLDSNNDIDLPKLIDCLKNKKNLIDNILFS
jgi:hypothetical protein